ncbi:MAG: hypothetical protein M3461_24010 [Pseudomonadota bacterium]|nr:hypothetical protein [Pseudomonadota bacterium]
MRPERALEPPASKLGHQLARQVHPAPGGFGLKLRESLGRVLLAHVDLARRPIDTAPREPEELTFPQAGQHGGEDDYAPARISGRQERLDLGRGEDVLLDEVVATARTGAELRALGGIGLKPLAPDRVEEQGAE